ncbi:MAG TPA: thiamine phosphate synthase [Sphingomonas sp.]|jgi:thiamine-phosphate pyrophosphorylase|nr:thiamine phosphate synthase [Sphingomonas sp.]
MRRRQTLPRLWLITDPRGGDPVTLAKRLPRGSGVVFRHFDLKPKKRAKLFARLDRIANRRGLVLLVATEPDARGRWCAVDSATGLLVRTVHNRREYIAAWREGADCVFVSPVFATRSHPKARPLGPVRLGLMLDGRLPAIALGGMSAKNFLRLSGLNLYGWAGIDAFRT